METVFAWTRQVKEVLEEIERTGSYHVREEYVRAKNGEISDYYLELYRWYTRQARRRIEIPAEYDLPIWLSLTEAQKLPPAPGTVSFTLEIPADHIVIADMDKWGYRVNYMYVPVDPADERRHNRVFVPSDNMDNNVGTIWEIRPEWIREVEHYE